MLSRTLTKPTGPNRPPWHHALRLWLLTNAGGTAVIFGIMLIGASWQGVPAVALPMGLLLGLVVGLLSLVTVPFAVLLFYLLPRLTRFRYRQLVAALGLTALFLLPLGLVLALLGTASGRYDDGVLVFALPYWPAALASALYLYHPWLFAPPPTEAEPWV